LNSEFLSSRGFVILIKTCVREEVGSLHILLQNSPREIQIRTSGLLLEVARRKRNLFIFISRFISYPKFQIWSWRLAKKSIGRSSCTVKFSLVRINGVTGDRFYAVCSVFWFRKKLLKVRQLCTHHLASYHRIPIIFFFTTNAFLLWLLLYPSPEFVCDI
jgi:hypothetical protein